MIDINVFCNEHFMITVKISDGGHLEASIPQDKALPTLLNSTPEISEKRRGPFGSRLFSEIAGMPARSLLLAGGALASSIRNDSAQNRLCRF